MTGGCLSRVSPYNRRMSAQDNLSHEQFSDTKLVGGGGYGHGPAMLGGEAQQAQQHMDGWMAGRRGQGIDWNSEPLPKLHGWNAGTTARQVNQ